MRTLAQAHRNGSTDSGRSDPTVVRSSAIARIDVYHASNRSPRVVSVRPDDGLALCLVVAGTWEYRYGKQWHRRSPGDVIVVGFSGDPAEFVRSQAGAIVLRLLPGAVDPDRTFFAHPVVRLDVARLISSAVAATNDDEFDSYIFELFDAASQRSLRRSRQSRTYRLRIERMKRFIERHFLGSLTVADVAASVNVGLFTGLRQFKSATGETPNDYIIRLRLARAKRLLLETNASIGEVAEHSGFRTHSYFTRTFKMHTGITPSLYRRQVSAS